MSRAVPVALISSRRRSEYGGKAVSLGALSRAGFTVPNAFAFSVREARHFFRVVLSETDLPANLARVNPSDVLLSDIRHRLLATPIPELIRRDLVQTFRALLDDGAKAICVRSSSPQEDGLSYSAAGLYESVVGVDSEAELEDAVRVVWSSLFKPEVFRYLGTMGDPEATPEIALILQAMVPAEISGTLFTANALTGDTSELIIDASYGLGLHVADGSVSPDTIRLGKADLLPRDQVIGRKLERFDFRGGALVNSSVDEALRDELCLDQRATRELARLGLEIERALGCPQDLEWARANGSFYVLQSRAITTPLSPWSPRVERSRRAENPRDPAQIVWSNVNVGEALPGVATPLTWSVLSGFSELGFRRAFGALGCSPAKHTTFVRGFRGRIYLNLSELLSVLTQVPGISPKLIGTLGGGAGLVELDALTSSIEAQSKRGFLRRLPLTVARLARENLRFEERLAEFEAAYEVDKKRLRGIDPRVLPSASLERMSRDVARLLDESGSILLTCYGNLLGCVAALSALLHLTAKDQASDLRRELLSGLSDLDSAAPGLSIWHIAEQARREPDVLIRLTSDELPTCLSELPEGATRRALSAFFEAFGHRGPREAELSEKRWREDPTLIFATLRLFLSEETQGSQSPIDREAFIRQRHEAALARAKSAIPLAARPVLRRLLRLCRRFMRLRERLRGYVVEVLGEYRRVAVDASRRLAAREPSVGKDAAFYLTEEELWASLRSPKSLTVLIKQRRARHQRDLALPDPPPTFVGYLKPRSLPRVAREIQPGDVVVGLAASSGVIEGHIRIVRNVADVADVQAGEVLVLSTADVGMTPLFLTAAAVVTSLGGPLSHAAVVLREYGVPSVMNINQADILFQNGDRVLVDGGAGTVALLERQSS